MVPTAKSQCYLQFRNRFISWFSLLTDQVGKIKYLEMLHIFPQEIEDGIDLLDALHEGNNVPVVIREHFLVAYI